MTVTYFSNFLNHHQANVADELYEKLGTDYTFVELCPIYDWLLKGGYSDLSSRPYVLQAWRSPENYRKAEDLALNADVALFGGPETLKLEVMRAKTGKLTFDVGERWLKRGLLNLASPRLLRYFWYYYTVFSKENVYKLCSSAYACGDHYKLYSFKNRCYKWGYFTKVEDFPFETSANFDVSSEETEVHLMWCARFLRLKHPELPVRLARRLKDKGYKFVFDMYGSGVELENVKRLASELEVTDVLRFHGNLPNDKILEQMRQHEIFIFTSDKNEGWGAVLNESMSNGCAVVASDEIGSVPFLVEDGVNGLVFKSEDLDSLETKVMSLLDNADCRRTIAANAMRTMRTLWSPQNAADNLLRLIDDLQAGRDTSIAVGPCSKALPI